MAETYVVTALPHTADPTAPFHLSLFVTHRLTPEADGAVLADFPVTADWTARLAGAELRLRGWRRRGRPVSIGGRLLLDPLQPALWPRVFPGDLAVGGWVVPDHTAVPWRTWPAHRAQQDGLLVHALSMFSSPVTAPTPSGSALVTAVLGTLGFPSAGRVRLEDVLDGSLDRAITARLDDGAGLGEGRQRGALGVNVGQVLLDAHAARRYYQREEEQRPYADHPVPGAVLPPVVKPRPDFGRRVASLGDTPALMRALGLVLDVVLDDVADLAGLTAVSAELVLPDVEAVPSPRTACTVLGTSFTVPSSSDAWDAGRLKVGDERRFTVLDVDPDATALKLEQFLRNVPRLVVSEGNGDPTSAAPASLRATGFALAEADRARSLHQRLEGAADADAALLAGRLDPLSLEQVTRGLRLEVWDDVSRTWHSLHWRAPRTTVDGELVLPEEPEQAFLQGAALTSAEGVAGAPKHAHEVVAGWDGWSLAVAPPGGVVVHEDGEEQVHPAAPVDPDPVHPVATQSRVVPGTLPRLRYGRSYSFRAYAVDLAGNSPPHDVQGPDGAPSPTAATDLEPATALLRDRPSGATRLAGAAGSSTSAAAVLRSLRPAPAVGPSRRARATARTSVDTGHPELDRVLTARLTPVVPAQTRADRVEAAFSGALESAPSLLDRTDLRLDPVSYAEVLGQRRCGARRGGRGRHAAPAVPALGPGPRAGRRRAPPLHRGRVAAAAGAAQRRRRRRHRGRARGPRGRGQRGPSRARPAVARRQPAPPRAAEDQPAHRGAARPLRRSGRHRLARAAAPRPGRLPARRRDAVRHHRGRPRGARPAQPAARGALPRRADRRPAAARDAGGPAARRRAVDRAVRRARRRRPRAALPARPAGRRPVDGLPRRAARRAPERAAGRRGHHAPVARRLAAAGAVPAGPHDRTAAARAGRRGRADRRRAARRAAALPAVVVARPGGRWTCSGCGGRCRRC